MKEIEIKQLLEKSQYNFDDYKIQIPSYRSDILHPYDVIEDIGIMYGFDKIKELPLKTFTVGGTSKMNEFIDKIRELIVGMGYQEILSPILTNKDSLYKNMNIDDVGTIEIDEFMSENYSVVRSWVVPGLISILSKNKHVGYPQRIFEEGLINTRKGVAIIESNSVAIATSHEKVDYTEIRQVLDFIMRCFGLAYDIEDIGHGSFIEGRVGSVVVKGKHVAYLGEINPEVLNRWGLEIPVAALELNLTELFEVVKR